MSKGVFDNGDIIFVVHVPEERLGMCENCHTVSVEKMPSTQRFTPILGHLKLQFGFYKFSCGQASGGEGSVAPATVSSRPRTMRRGGLGSSATAPTRTEMITHTPPNPLKKIKFP